MKVLVISIALFFFSIYVIAQILTWRQYLAIRRSRRLDPSPLVTLDNPEALNLTDTTNPSEQQHHQSAMDAGTHHSHHSHHHDASSPGHTPADNSATQQAPGYDSGSHDSGGYDGGSHHAH